MVGCEVTVSVTATTPASTWLSASPVAPGTVAGSANVVINTASLTTPGTYNGTVTIAATGATSQVVTVTLVVSSTVTAAPPSLSFAYTLGGTAPAAQSLSIAGSGGVSFTTAAATTSGGSWLVATPVSPGTVPGSASVSINTAALTTGGTYKGTVTVGAAGDASPQVVDVTLVVSNNITVSPSALNFTYTVGGTAPAAQPITVSGTPAGLAFTAVTATTAGGSWLVAAPVSPGTTPGSANVSVNTNGLAAGKYTGTVTIGANLATAQVVAVTLTVTSQPTITLNTSTLTFNYQIGSTAPAAQTLTITGTTGLAFTATVGSGTPWLSAAPVSPRTAPGSASVSVSTSGLAAGTYNGTVTIAATGATSQPVSVTLVVTQPALTVNTSSLSFTYQIGGTNPNPQTLTITGTTGLAFTATAATTTGGSWLSATPVAPGTLNGSATVAIITTNLTTVGTYSGTVTIAAAGATSKVVNVTLVVTTAPMVPAPTSLSFTYTIGGTAPLPQGLNITGGSGLAYTAAPASGASWLSVATGSSGTLPILLSIGANTTGLTAGKYTSSIIVTAAGAPNSPLSVPVTLTVSGATSTITVSPLSLSFTAPSIGAAPASQTANVSATAATAVTVSTLGGAWLSASLSAGTTPAVVTVAVNQAGLTAGTYTGTVVVTAATATNSPQNISVKLVVSAPATITASPSSLSFTYALGATAPATQSISVTSTAPVSFSTSVTNGSWLTVTSSSASTPATLTVSVNTASLTVATYTATISILSPNASNPEQLVFVSLVVSNKATLTASTASLTFTGQSGGTNPAVQSIGLTGSVAALPFSIATSPSWLSVSASSGTTPSTLVVTVNTAGMAQGSYKGSITITSSTATNSPIIIPVTLNVTAPLVVTGPTISTIVNAASYASNGFSPGAIVSIFGSLLGPQTATSFSVSSQGNVDNALAGVTVTVGGIPAIPLYVQNGQINVILPYTLGIGGQAAVQVSYNNLTTTEFNITLEPADVQIFTADASGTGQGSILNQDFSVNSATNPAAPGSVVQVFGTGAGQLTPVVIAGNVASDTLSWVALPYSATVNGETAKVLYAGSAPALVYGVDQFNVQLPTDLAAGSATIVLAVGDSTSQSSVTVFVQ